MKYLILTLTLTLFSCGTIENPTMERVENVMIENLNTKALIGTADIILNNPNPFTLDLSETDLVAIIDDIEVATLKQTYDTQMPANGEFKMPIKLHLDFDKLYKADPIGSIAKGMKIYKNREINIQFKGDIKMGKGSAMIAVPIDQIELVKF